MTESANPDHGKPCVITIDDPDLENFNFHSSKPDPPEEKKEARGILHYIWWGVVIFIGGLLVYLIWKYVL